MRRDEGVGDARVSATLNPVCYACAHAPADAEMKTRGWKAFQRTAYTAIVWPRKVALYLHDRVGGAAGEGAHAGQQCGTSGKGDVLTCAQAAAAG